MKREARLLLLCLSLSTSLLSAPAWPQTFKPSRPIDLIVHSAPGGGSDVFARAVVERWKKKNSCRKAFEC